MQQNSKVDIVAGAKSINAQICIIFYHSSAVSVDPSFLKLNCQPLCIFFQIPSFQIPCNTGHQSFQRNGRA